MTIVPAKTPTPQAISDAAAKVADARMKANAALEAKAIACGAYDVAANGLTNAEQAFRDLCDRFIPKPNPNLIQTGATTTTTGPGQFTVNDRP